MWNVVRQLQELELLISVFCSLLIHLELVVDSVRALDRLPLLLQDLQVLVLNLPPRLEQLQQRQVSWSLLTFTEVKQEV